MRIVFAILLLLQQSPNWDKESTSDGIQTKIGTEPINGFPIFESTVEVNAPIKLVKEVLSDHEGLKEIVYGVTESGRLSNYSSKTIVYYRLDLPWPVSDKYGVVQEQVKELSSDHIEIEIVSVEDIDFKIEGLSKIEKIQTKWELTSINENKTRIVYRSSADPMGIPNWIVKLFLQTSPEETLKELRNKVESLISKN